MDRTDTTANAGPLTVPPRVSSPGGGPPAPDRQALGRAGSGYMIRPPCCPASKGPDKCLDSKWLYTPSGVGATETSQLQDISAAPQPAEPGTGRRWNVFGIRCYGQSSPVRVCQGVAFAGQSLQDSRFTAGGNVPKPTCAHLRPACCIFRMRKAANGAV